MARSLITGGAGYVEVTVPSHSTKLAITAPSLAWASEASPAPNGYDEKLIVMGLKQPHHAGAVPQGVCSVGFMPDRNGIRALPAPELVARYNVTPIQCASGNNSLSSF